MLLNSAQARKQGGAALVVGLLLLLVLTLLAIAGMNSASVEFIMAGNEQYHQNAFQAAETGIAQAMAQGTFNPANIPAQTIVPAAPYSPTDSYSAVINRQLDGVGQTPPADWGSSGKEFTAYHFQIQSTGTSARNGNALNTQGVALLAKKDQTFTPDPAANTTQLQ